MAEQSTSALNIYSARPTVRVDGQEYPVVSELVTGMVMTEQEGGLSSLELRLDNVASDDSGRAAPAFEDDRVIRIGAALSIYAGDETAPVEIFVGRVTALEADFPAGDLTVFAEDAFQRARLSRRTAIHADVSPKDLVERLASETGLTPVVSGLTGNTATWVQLNESDLAFTRRVLARFDADIQVVGSELHAAPRSEVERGTLELELHSQLRRARAIADVAHQVTEVTTHGFDALQGAPISAVSVGSHAGPGAGRSGADVLEAAFGPRSEHVGHIGVKSSGEAQAVVDAAFDDRARRFVSLDGTAEGNARLRVGTVVRVRGLGPRFDNEYYVTLARHRFDRLRGYETDFAAECAYFGEGA